MVLDIWRLESDKILLVQKFLHILAKVKKNLSSNLIATYIFEKLMIRPTTCASIVLKFEVFGSYF